MMILITLMYPLAVWFGERRVEGSSLAGLLMVVGLTRLHALKIGQPGRWWLAGTVVLFLLTGWNNGWLALRLYPVLVNAALLGVFAYSLVVPPSMIERRSSRVSYAARRSAGRTSSRRSASSSGTRASELG